MGTGEHRRVALRRAVLLGDPVNLNQSWQNTLDNIFVTGPKVLVFLLVLFVGWIVARVIRNVVTRVLNKVGFGRMVDNTYLGNGLARSGYDASGLVAKLAYYAVLLLTLQMAFGVFGPNAVSSLLESVVGWMPKAIVAVVLVVVASAIARVVKDLLTAALGHLGYGRLLANIAGIFIMAIGVIAALNQIGIATTVTTPVLVTFLATAGAIAAIGIGGGMIKPMQHRWERILSGVERDTGIGGAYDRGREDAARGSGTSTTESVTERWTVS